MLPLLLCTLEGSQTELPMIDLDQDASRQIVVDRQPGQYLGHVSTVLLEDGRTILAAYPMGHGRGPIVLKRSRDGGRTWSFRLPVPENWKTSLETPTIHRTIDPKTGKKRLILWSGLYPARLASSDDDGRTWTPLAPVGDWGGIVVMGSVERLKDGRYAAWFHDDGRFFRNAGKATGVFTLFQTESADGGLTWSEPQAIWSGSDIHLCEPGAVRSPDGRQIALLLRENTRRKNSHVMFSDDEAKTWSEPKELPTALTGDRHTARYAKDGRLVVTFRDMAEGPTKGLTRRPCSWARRTSPAPGSATAGQPASESRPTSSPRRRGWSRAGSSWGRVCSSRTRSSISCRGARVGSRLRKARAVLGRSTTKTRSPAAMRRVFSGKTRSRGVSPSGVGIR